MVSISAPRDPVVQVIEPNRCWYRIPVREILRYRDLIFLFIRRDFVATYKQTVLGPLWHVISPLTTTVIFTIVFGNLAKLPTDGLPKPVFYLCGQLAWGYFSRCVASTSGTFTGNVGLFGKVYFPRLVVPVSQVFSSLIGYSIQFVTFLIVWCYVRFFTGAGTALHMQGWLVLLPFVLVLSAAAGSGVGLWNSSLTAKYRDFGRIFNFLMNIWMWATPIVY
ncbi:MAG: ABC transporter permease, partial [Kiritimatiellia bacterium]